MVQVGFFISDEDIKKTLMAKKDILRSIEKE